MGYWWNYNGDGYVDIVAADCGCVYGCLVHERQDQFECLCPSSTLLAPDLNDCYLNTSQEVQHIAWPVDSESALKLTLADFGGSTNLFSISAELTAEISDRGSGSGYTNAAKEVTTMSSGDILCAMVFIGENEEFVLLSNAAQNGENKLTSLSILQLNLTDGHIIEMQQYTEFLSSAVLVTGALLISQGDCFIRGHLFMNVSILENTNDQAGSGGIKYPILQDKIIGNPSAVSLLLCLLQPATDTPPTSDDEGSPVAVELSALEIAAIGLAFAILTLTILTIFWLCIWYHKRIER
jgi:hypothetical protein